MIGKMFACQRRRAMTMSTRARNFTFDLQAWLQAPPTTIVLLTFARASSAAMLTKKELEDLRPWVAAQVTAVSGKFNAPLVDQALDCIGKSFSRQSTTGER